MNKVILPESEQKVSVHPERICSKTFLPDCESNRKYVSTAKTTVDFDITPTEDYLKSSRILLDHLTR